VIFIANWIETHLRIVDKTKQLVLLVHNPFQWILLQYVAWCAQHDLLCQLIVPKGRQGGVSTWVQAWNFACAVLFDRRGQAFRAVTVAHVEASSLTIFRMSRLFEKKLSSDWACELESRQKGMIEWPNGSGVRVATAGAGDALERGSTLNSIHASEAGSWAAEGVDPSEAWTAIMGALSDGPDSLVVMESTPKGRDPFFFRMIEDSLAHKNTFQVVFLPWLLCEDYRMSYDSYRRERLMKGWDPDTLPETFAITEDEVALVDEVAGQVVQPGHEWHVHPYKITTEQLVWRRHTIEKKCDGKVERFQREYPSTLEECWTATAKIMVSQETVDFYWKGSETGERGEVIQEGARGQVKFVPRGDGSCEVWSHPVKGRVYVIGADVADGSERGDGQSATVLDAETLEEVCAVYAEGLDTDQYARLLCRVGYYYNRALLGIENNYDPSCAKTAREAGYSNLYYYRDLEGVSGQLGRSPKPGWATNRRTRPLMIAAISGAARDREYKTKNKGFASELGTFSWNDGKRRFQASHGKRDDRIMSASIAVCLTGRRDAAGRKRTPPPMKDPGSEAYQAYLRELEREERTGGRGPIYL
jgi:hypothetical protein